MKCKYDNNKLKFRTPKKDSRGYLRLVCLHCGRNYKASNNKYSHPFEARPGKPRVPSLVAHWLKRMTALGLIERNGNSYRALRVPAKLRKQLD